MEHRNSNGNHHHHHYSDNNAPPRTPNTSAHQPFHLVHASSWPVHHGAPSSPKTELPSAVQIIQEVASVTLWLVLTTAFRIVVWQLQRLHPPFMGPGIPIIIITTTTTMVNNNPVLLDWIHELTGTYPNFVVRTAEWRMRRIRGRQYVLVMLIHLATVWGFFHGLSVVWEPTESVLIRPLLSSLNSHATAATTNTPTLLWFMLLLLKQVLLTSAFVVALLILPSLLVLNHLSPVWTLLWMYPLYTNMTTILSPAVTVLWWALPLLGTTPTGGGAAAAGITPSWSGLLIGSTLCQLLGGWLAGSVMLVYFPDDEGV